MNAPTPAPAVLTGVTATAGDEQVVLNWTDPADASITGYSVAVKVGTGNYDSGTPVPGATAATTTHTVEGLTNGTAYAFRVRATNANGDGNWSTEVTATPEPEWTPDAYSGALDAFAQERKDLKLAKAAVETARQKVVEAQNAVTQAQSDLQVARDAVQPAMDDLEAAKVDAAEAAKELRDLLTAFIG